MSKTKAHPFTKKTLDLTKEERRKQKKIFTIQSLKEKG